MKRLIPTYAAAQVLLDDDEVLEVQWCVACKDKVHGVALQPDREACPACGGTRVVRRVRKQPAPGVGVDERQDTGP